MLRFIKHAVGGLAIQNGPVRSVWRNLPLPVPMEELHVITDVPMDPPPPAGTHSAFFLVLDSRLAVIAQWFQTTWTRLGFALDSAPQTPMARQYIFEDADGGIVLVAFRVQGNPVLHTAVLISDLREVDPAIVREAIAGNP